MHPDTVRYNKSLAPVDREICDLLAKTIDQILPEAENKIWHAHPVWFLEGNPVVGYSKLKSCVRLLFWSGQSFAEKELKNEGSFKAAEARYTAANQIELNVNCFLLYAKIDFTRLNPSFIFLSAIFLSYAFALRPLKRLR